jgi:flagellar protein FlaG
MAEHDINTVTSATGTHAVLKPPARMLPQAGNMHATAGKNVPLAAVRKPDLEALARELNLASRSIGRDLRFEVDMESGRSVIQVLDRETGEVIRQIPPEKAELSVAGNGAVQLRLYDEKI